MLYHQLPSMQPVSSTSSINDIFWFRTQWIEFWIFVVVYVCITCFYQRFIIHLNHSGIFSGLGFASSNASVVKKKSIIVSWLTCFWVPKSSLIFLETAGYLSFSFWRNSYPSWANVLKSPFRIEWLREFTNISLDF